MLKLVGKIIFVVLHLELFVYVCLSGSMIITDSVPYVILSQMVEGNMNNATQPENNPHQIRLNRTGIIDIMNVMHRQATTEMSIRKSTPPTN